MGNSKSQLHTEAAATHTGRGSVPVKNTKKSNVVSNMNRAKEARQVTVTARRKRAVKIEIKNNSNHNDGACTPVKAKGPKRLPAQSPLTPTSQNTLETVTSPDRSPETCGLKNISFVGEGAGALPRGMIMSPLLDDHRDDSNPNLVSDEERATFSASASASSASFHHSDDDRIIHTDDTSNKPISQKGFSGMHAELAALEQDWKSVSPKSINSENTIHVYVDRQKKSFSFQDSDQSDYSEMRAELAALEQDWKSVSHKSVDSEAQAKSFSFEDSLRNSKSTCDSTNDNENVSHQDMHEEIDEMNYDFDQMLYEFDLEEKLSGDTKDDAENDDDGSLGSNSMFSQSEGSEYDSIGPYSVSGWSCSIGELSKTPSTASLFKNREVGASIVSRSRTASISSSTPTLQRPAKPNANNAFETLPRHLINSSLLRQAASTLRDERFLGRRILKLGAVHAARVHVTDFACMDRKITRDAVQIENERTALEASIPTSADFADGDDLDSVTIDSLELFEKCILELCGIQTVEFDITEGEGVNGDNASPLRPSPTGNDTAKMKEMRPKILLADGGRALYALGKYCQKADWNDDAMEFYKHALYLYFLDLGVEEPRLLDNSDDCDGFFYVQAARECVHESSPTHQYLGTLFTKMGDVHGRWQEKNDALRAYRASEVFWSRYISDLEIDKVENVKGVVAAVEALALSFNRIGGVYTAKGELEAATVAFNEALEMQIDTLGEEHVEVGKTLHNIGVCHRHNDDWDAALEYYFKAHQILEVGLGRDHLDTVRTLHNIGGVYRRQKEYAKAMECYKEVLAVRRNCLGDDHPSVAITLVSMAAVLRRCGKKEEANRFYAAAVQ